MDRPALALAVIAAGCTPPPIVSPEDPAAVPIGAAELWDGAVEVGARTTVGPLVVTSPRELGGTAFFAADPGGGPRSGVRVTLGRAIDDWPLPVGTAFTATGTLVQRRPPVLWIVSAADLAPVLPEDLDTATIAEATPADLTGLPAEALDELRFALAVAPGLHVTSVPDPLGRADAELQGAPQPVGGRFGPAPGYGRTGDLTGILDEELRLSARTAADWTGTFESDPPIEGVPLDKIDGIAPGTPLLLPELVLATPWSRDRRWAVLQDAAGAGAWVDVEGWNVDDRVAPGDLGRWTVEVRYDESGVYLRTWIAPRLRGTRERIVGKEPVDGAIVWFAADPVGPADAYGERPAGAWVLDDRLADLSGIPAGFAVAGIGAVRGDAGVRLAPILYEVRPPR